MVVVPGKKDALKFIDDLAFFMPENFSAEEIKDKLSGLDKKAVKEKIPLWPYFWWLIVIVSSLMGEWLYRRQHGLL